MTFTDWDINVAGQLGQTGPTGPAGTIGLSTDANNLSRLGSDSLIWTPATVTNNLINGRVTATVAANTTTFWIKNTLSGGDPSPSYPVYCVMPDATVVRLTAATSITIPAGFTFANQATSWIRIWVYLLATGVLAVRCCITGGKLAGPAPDRMSVLAFSGAGVFGNNYAAAPATAIPYRPIAYLDYDLSPQTSGNWINTPTRITQVGPNTLMPGAMIQELGQAHQSQVTCQTGGWTQTSTWCYIQPSFVQHAVRVECNADMLLNCAASNEYIMSQVWRNDATPIGQINYAYGWAQTVVFSFIAHAGCLLDYPGTTANTLYRLYFHIYVSGSNIAYCPHGGAWMQLAELMT